MSIDSRDTGVAPEERRALAKFVDRINTDDVALDAASLSGLPYERLRLLLDVFSNEASVGHTLVQPLLRPGIRVLEVGTGVGILSSFLKSRGVDIVGIEPGAAGYGYMPTLARAVARKLGNLQLQPLSIGATALHPNRHGIFNLIYSVHVVEHILEIDEAFAALASVMAPSAQMVHLCPNYSFPYDPHLGIPLVPGFPRSSQYLFPALIRANQEVWDGLNFLTAWDAQRLALQNDLSISFDRGVMSSFVRRIETDVRFRTRQAKLIVWLARALSRSGMVSMIDRFPPSLSSPMVMRLSRRTGER